MLNRTPDFRPRAHTSRRHALALTLILAALAFPTTALSQPVPIDPLAIPKYVDALPMPLRVPATGTSATMPLEISLNEFQQKLLPASFYATLPAPFDAGSYLWCYQAAGWPQTFPGPTLEAKVGTPTFVHYTNNLQGPNGSPAFLQSRIAVDQTIHWADPLGQHGSMLPYAGPVPAVTHLHGGEVPSAFDGGPDAWFTPGMAQKGKGFVSDTYVYPNAQAPTTLWYHDHALGSTRTNVYAGLAGFYLLRDPASEPANLPGGAQDPKLDQYGNPYEREIVIQDRMFDTDGQLYWPKDGVNPDVHPFWTPEFFGDVIMVNGKTWPYLQVEPRRYRFRLLNGSNARFYDLRFLTSRNRMGPAVWQIGSDGGLLDRPVMLLDPQARRPLPLLMAPGERLDVIIDFSDFAGRTLTLANNAPAPFPAGLAPDPATTGQIMQVRVGTRITGRRDLSLAPWNVRRLRPVPIERPTRVPVTRALTLNENMGAGGPLEVYVNNTMWDMMITENAMVGSTEVWEIINLTADTHPIHLHLVQFQILERQAFDPVAYGNVYGMPMEGMGPPLPYDVKSAATGNKLGGNPDITPYLAGPRMAPDANERGWKDTFRMNPGEVTRVLVRIAPQDAAARSGGMLAAGMNLFPFDPAATLGVTNDGFGYPGGPGYVWHCHIIDHEDNEMMRPFVITSAPMPVAAALAPVPEAPMPLRVTLAPVQPNPVRGLARIAFTLPQSDDVELLVFDIAGRVVSTLARGHYAAGEHVVEWNATGENGRALAKGAYLARLRTGGTTQVRKLVVVD